MSIMAAMAAGLLPTNTQVVSINGVNVGKNFANATVKQLIALGVLDPSNPASVLGFAGGPQFGG